jgi:hypothetical protein
MSNEAGPSTHEQLETERDVNTTSYIPAKESSNTIKLSESLDENNWVIWKERMKLTLCICGLEGYAEGVIKCPKVPLAAKHWDFDDSRAQFIIINNVTSSQMVHIGLCSTTQKMWLNLEAIHKAKSHHSAIANICNLLCVVADEDTNIGDHLMTLKTYWERVNLMTNDDFKLPDLYFKIIISSSLPSSWDIFTESYIGGQKGQVEKDPKKLMSSQEFIGIIKEEYGRRKGCTAGIQMESTSQANVHQTSLFKHIGVPSSSTNGTPNARCMFCKQCGRQNHVMSDCMYLGADKCNECGRFGHLTKHCWKKNGAKALKQKQKVTTNQNKPYKRAKTEQMHAVIEEVKDDEDKEEEVIVFGAEVNSIQFDVSEEGQYSGFDEYDPNGPNEIDECILWYDWLADSTTTSHITNQRDILINYKPAHSTNIAGVGNINTAAIGRGTVELDTEYEGQRYILCLQDILYIPTNRNSLILLG